MLTKTTYGHSAPLSSTTTNHNKTSNQHGSKSRRKKGRLSLHFSSFVFYHVWKYARISNHCYISFPQNECMEEVSEMTSLKKRLDSILNEISTISKAIRVSGNSPPCCLVFHENDLISCDVLGPLPKDRFLSECSKCKARIKRLVDSINKEKRGN